MSVDIDSLTVKELREIGAIACSSRRPVKSKTMAGGEVAVIVRAYSGVFFGYLVSKTGNSVELSDARQIYSWDSAGLLEKSNTCPDIAARGLGTGSKVSAPAPKAFIEQVGAVFVMTPAAAITVVNQKWGSR